MPLCPTSLGVKSLNFTGTEVDAVTASGQSRKFFCHIIERYPDGAIFVRDDPSTQMFAGADRRVEAAARKRERTRTRILDATILLCAQNARGPIVIEDVIRCAGVSRGTFYAHFESIHEAMAAVTERLSDELGAELAELYRDLDDPLLRVSVATQATLMRSILDPAWGKALGDARLLSRPVMDRLMDNLIRGRERGDFRFSDLQAAIATHLGSFIQAAIMLQNLESDHRSFIEEVTFLHLRGLGVAETKAWHAVRWASDDIRERFLKSKTPNLSARTI